MMMGPHDLAVVDRKLRSDARMGAVRLDLDRLARAKKAYTTRRVDFAAIATVLRGEVAPRPGDLVLARVDRVYHDDRIELQTGRLASLFVGDELVVCYGHRCALDQFEAVVPTDLGPCQLVAAGGVASRVLAQHGHMMSPAEISPVGLLGDDDGRPLNLARWGLRTTAVQRPGPLTVAVVGTSATMGKSTAAAHLIRGMVRSGLKVGAARVTGAGGGRDSWLLQDAGACQVLDFTDVGYASTYRTSPRDLDGIFLTLVGHLQEAELHAIVVEVADGLMQSETAALLSATSFAAVVDGVILAAGDALAAAAGVSWLRDRRLSILAVSGTLTASPLAIRGTEGATGLPVMDLDHLADPEVTASLAARLGGAGPAAEVV